MASVPVAAVAPAAADWPLSHPWTWMLTALAATGLAFGGSRLFGDAALGAVLALVLAGLFTAGVAVWVGFGSAGGTSRALPRGAETYIAGVLGLGALVLGGWFGMRLLRELGEFGQDLLRRYSQQEEGWAGPALATWTAADVFCDALVLAVAVVLTATLAAAAFRPTGWTARDRGTALLASAGLAVRLAAAALEEWDSLSLFLSAASLVALVAAALYALPVKWRRAGVAGLVLLHFGGIGTAALGAPPEPWIVAQMWTRFYRPYLEFMYLNNAYRYYSPEPGPPSLLWFRVEFTDGPRILSRWIFVPDMDTEKGRHRHPMSLVYQRRLSLTQNTEPIQESPPMTMRDADGVQRIHPVYLRRLQRAPQDLSGPLPLGQVPPQPTANKPLVPFHPDVRPEIQRQEPNFYSKDLIRSYAKYALSLPFPGEPRAVPRTVKVYRVRHEIMRPRDYAAGWHPTDLGWYLPYYVGEFDPQGRLTKEASEDPLLYWLVPNLRDDREHPDNIRCYYLRHAGDRDWVLWPDKKYRPE